MRFLREENSNLQVRCAASVSQVTALQSRCAEFERKTAQYMQEIAKLKTQQAEDARARTRFEEEIGELKSQQESTRVELEQQIEQRRNIAKEECSRLQSKLLADNGALSKEIDKFNEHTSAVKKEILNMIGQQLEHYARGDRMKLERNVLSMNAVLSEGYAAKNLISVYQLLHFASPSAVLRFAIEQHASLSISSDHNGICVANL